MFCATSELSNTGQNLLFEYFLENFDQLTPLKNSQPKIVIGKQNQHKRRGGSRIFSRGRGGADFQKKLENFDDFFFRSTKLIFRALPKHSFAPIFGKFSAPQANF